MPCLFEIEDSVNLTIQGFVITGQILSGSAKIGQSITLDKVSHPIIGIEMADGKDENSDHKASVVLVLGNLSNYEIEIVQSFITKGSTLELVDEK